MHAADTTAERHSAIGRNDDHQHKASPNAPVIAAESQQKPPTGGTTLPRTGSDTTGPLVAGLASLVVGAGLLAKVALGARRERGEAARTS